MKNLINNKTTRNIFLTISTILIVCGVFSMILSLILNRFFLYTQLSFFPGLLLSFISLKIVSLVVKNYIKSNIDIQKHLKISVLLLTIVSTILLILPIINVFYQLSYAHFPQAVGMDQNSYLHQNLPFICLAIIASFMNIFASLIILYIPNNNYEEKQEGKAILEIKRFHYLNEDVIDEIENYKNQTHVFNGFFDFNNLIKDDIKLICKYKAPTNKEKGYVPVYYFDIYFQDLKIGWINIRIGYTEGLYYGGNIGFAIDGKYRGNGYVVIACKLIKEVAKAHKMNVLGIANREDNIQSIRVCQKLGARYIHTVYLPEENDMREDGRNYNNIWRWYID